MQEALKHFTTNTNRWKEFESELKARFDDRERMQYLDLRELKMAVQNGVFPLRKLAGPNNGQQFKPDLPERTKVDTTKNICFRKEISDIAIVSNFIFGEVREPREVGEACFDNMLDEAKK